jgi:hypothetical protein
LALATCWAITFEGRIDLGKPAASTAWKLRNGKHRESVSRSSATRATPSLSKSDVPLRAFWTTPAVRGRSFRSPPTLGISPDRFIYALRWALALRRSGYSPTSEMSHDHSRRDSCWIPFSFRNFHFDLLSVARGVTAVGVGSGDLLAEFLFRYCGTSRRLL